MSLEKQQVAQDAQAVQESIETLAAQTYSDTDSERDYELPDSASTPNLIEAMDHIKRSMSFKSFQELSARPSSEVRRRIQKKLWRPQDDETKIPNDWERLMVHVIRGASRAFTLAYGIRSSIQFLFVLIKALRTRKPIDKNNLKAAFTGESTVRFALLFGLWAAIYKFTSNALRLTTPPRVRPRMKGQRSLSGSPDSSVRMEKDMGLTLTTRDKLSSSKKKAEFRHLSAYDPRVRKWHAYLAGAVSTLAFVVVKRDFMRSFGTQIFVRGLEGMVHTASKAGYLHIPYGSFIVFGLANMQIILSWLGAPQYLERSYKLWIDKASSLPKESFNLYTQSVTTGELDPWDLVRILGGKVPEQSGPNPYQFDDIPPSKEYPMGVSGTVIGRVYRWMDHGNPARYPTCALQHPYTANHLYATARSFWLTTKFVMPVYMTLYFVPMFFLRPKVFFKSPLATSVRSLLGALRSTTFLSTYVLIVKSMFSLLHAMSDGIYYNKWLNQFAVMRAFSRLLVDHRMKGLAGFMSCLSLFVEHHRRRNELTMYVLPKALESFWKSGRARGIFPHVPMGDYILTAIGLSMIMGTYAENPQNLSKIVSMSLFQFLGRN